MTNLPRICSACATSNPPQAAFCFGCGQALRDVAATDLLHQRYHLLHQLGSGGFGSVYQVEDTQLGKRLVAVKEMSSQSNLSAQENEEAAQAFKKEALLLAELLHPNLPRIYDHFSEGGRWYLVMDFIEGETLETYIAQQPAQYLPLAEALEVGLQLCDVLDYLHTRQPPVIFRDLKPLNIMRTGSGHLYLIDFGIARHFKPPNGRHLVSGGAEDVVRIWDITTGQPAFIYAGHTEPPEVGLAHKYAQRYPQQYSRPRLEIAAVAWSPDGKWIASGDTANIARVWRGE